MFCKSPLLTRVFLIRAPVVSIVLMNLFVGFHVFHVVNTNVNAAPFFSTCSPPCNERFDSVAPPNLPSGWSATLSTGQAGDLPWRTVNTTSESFPNSASAGGPNHVSDNWLISKTFPIVSSTAASPAILTFARKNNLETGFDGMVLEISLDGGFFVDVEAAGGSFISGGYNATISVSTSPIVGRRAWTGDSVNFLTTSVRLPTSPTPQSVTLRWRVATDHSIGSVGAFIDNVTLTEAPANDHFRDAQPILGAQGLIHGTNIGATKESGEPIHAANPGGVSVWYKWQAPNTGRFVFTTYRSNTNTQLAVYTGDTLSGLTSVASNAEGESISCGFSSRVGRVGFNAVGGTVYHIAVDGHSTFSTGDIVLRWGRSATISGRVTTASGGSGGAPDQPIRLEGDVCRSGSSINFPDVPTGGSYNVIVRSTGWFYSRWGTTASISPLTGDVSDYNYFLSSPTANISGAVTINNGTASDLTVTCALPPSSPSPMPPRTATLRVSQAPGPVTVFFECVSLSINAQYIVTPSKPGFVFDPVIRTVPFLGSLGVNVSPFSATPIPPRTISGRVTHPNGTTGFSGVSIALGGSQTGSSVTDANGNYSFSNLPAGGNYTVTPSNANLMFTPGNRSFNNLTEDQTTANFTATFLLQLVLDDVGQIAAIDSVLLLRDPFPVINTANLLNRGVDRNTRVAIFLSNFQLGSGELPSSVVINLVGSNSQSYDIPAEDVRSLPDGLTRVTFRLPDTLTPGTCTLFVKARGLTSNIGAMTIRN